MLTDVFIFMLSETATTEIYTLSLHDALPIWPGRGRAALGAPRTAPRHGHDPAHRGARSEEHTSELQSQSNLVCRLLLEKKHELCRAPMRQCRKSVLPAFSIRQATTTHCSSPP